MGLKKIDPSFTAPEESETDLTTTKKVSLSKVRGSRKTSLEGSVESENILNTNILKKLLLEEEEYVITEFAVPMDPRDCEKN